MYRIALRLNISTVLSCIRETFTGRPRKGKGKNDSTSRFGICLSFCNIKLLASVLYQGRCQHRYTSGDGRESDDLWNNTFNREMHFLDGAGWDPLRGSPIQATVRCPSRYARCIHGDRGRRRNVSTGRE